MDLLATWEKILLGVFALLIILLLFPGVKTLLKESADTPRDWPAVLLPLLAVVAFVALLIIIV